MNNKMADDYMDSLIKEIEELQSENAKLKQQVSDMRCCMNCKHCTENGACDEEIECGVSYKNWEWEG